jgi:HEAT repeat protein
MPRLASVLVLAIACAARAGSAASAQEPPKPPAPTPPAPTPPAPNAPPAKKDGGDDKGEKKDEKPKEPDPITDSDGDAAKLVASQEKGLADKEPRVRAEALEPFLLHRNEAYVKVIGAVLLKDKSADVAKTAARALGNQPYAKSADVLLDYVTNPKLGGVEVEVSATAVHSLAKTGLGKKGFDRLREVFDHADAKVKAATMETLCTLKEKRAFSLFVDNTDEPKGDASDPHNNLSADQWKKKHEEWDTFKKFVRDGLKAITGVSLGSSKQWIDWAQKDGKKMGFVYQHGK